MPPAHTIDFTPNPDLYPFESHWFESSAGALHYVDESMGRPLLLLHGNPDWSFLYRKIILALRGRFRCIALDYPGFGLSAHPPGYGYTAAEHALVVQELVEALDLQDMIVMGQDWGGPIGMATAAAMPDRVHGLVMGNTWYWPDAGRGAAVFSAVLSSWPLQWLILHRNLFVNPLMKWSLRAKLSQAEFDHYVDVVPTVESRRGIAEFPRQIRDARPWLGEVERRVAETLTDKPMLLTWGMRDPGFGRGPFLARWQEAFPQATLIELPDAAHYIQEDAPDAIAAAIVEKFAN